MLDRILGLDLRRRLLLYVALTVIIYGTMIVLDTAFMVDQFEDGVAHADLDVYRERTQTIIDGGWIYRDVHTETPPVINYLLVPAQLLGGGEYDQVYAAYFSAFALLGASAIYLGLRDWDDDRAYLAGLLFLLSPFIIVESTFGVEDEAIMILTFILPLLFMVRERELEATAAIAVGIWTKMFTLLLYPIVFLRSGWRARGKEMLILAAITLAVTLPFVICCLDDFTWFLEFYFLGVDGRQTGGSSVWHFLDMGGLGLPSMVSFALTGGSLLIAYIYCHLKGMDMWRSALVVMLAFFLFYPKIHTGYWLMPLVLLLPWAAEHRDIAIRTFLIYAPVIISTAFAYGDDAPPFIDEPWGWTVGLLLAALASGMLIETTVRAMRKESFLDRRVVA